MRQCQQTLCSLISMSFSFSPPFFSIDEISPWSGWGRDISPSSVDIITFPLSHPLLPIGHMYHCPGAVIEHIHLVLHSELHQGNYLGVILEFKINTGRKSPILHQNVFMLQIIFHPQKQHHLFLRLCKCLSMRLLTYLGFYNLHLD